MHKEEPKHAVDNQPPTNCVTHIGGRRLEKSETNLLDVEENEHFCPV